MKPDRKAENNESRGRTQTLFQTPSEREQSPWSQRANSRRSRRTSGQRDSPGTGGTRYPNVSASVCTRFGGRPGGSLGGRLYTPAGRVPEFDGEVTAEGPAQKPPEAYNLNESTLDERRANKPNGAAQDTDFELGCATNGAVSA